MSHKPALEVVSKQMRLCDTDFNLDFPQKEFEKQFANVLFAVELSQNFNPYTQN